MLENMFNGMFGKVANGMCRLSMNGGIAVKTSNGYKTYNVEKKRLTNCDNFVFNIAKRVVIIHRDLLRNVGKFLSILSYVILQGHTSLDMGQVRSPQNVKKKKLTNKSKIRQMSQTHIKIA